MAKSLNLAMTPPLELAAAYCLTRTAAASGESNLVKIDLDGPAADSKEAHKRGGQGDEPRPGRT